MGALAHKNAVKTCLGFRFHRVITLRQTASAGGFVCHWEGNGSVHEANSPFRWGDPPSFIIGVCNDSELSGIILQKRILYNV